MGSSDWSSRWFLQIDYSYVIIERSLGLFTYKVTKCQLNWLKSLLPYSASGRLPLKGDILNITKAQHNLVLFYPTFKCQLNCDYCSFHFDTNKFTPKKDWGRTLTWYEIIVCLNRFRNYHLELTGGEPLLYKDFRDLIAHIPSGSQWSITSNTLLDPAGTPPERCYSWHSSYHYLEAEKFAFNIKKLALGGMKPEINMLIRPDNFDDVEYGIKLFEGYKIDLLPEFNPGINWTQEMLDKYRQLALKYKIIYLIDDGSTPLEYEYKTWDWCSAGMDYFCVIGDGTVYRCYSDMMRNESIGTIFDFQFFTEPQRCGKECLGCGADIKQKKWNEKRIVTLD
jgi:MoaA/NifB/PqqE/SkfB family radical SAM enzyme